MARGSQTPAFRIIWLKQAWGEFHLDLLSILCNQERKQTPLGSSRSQDKMSNVRLLLQLFCCVAVLQATLAQDVTTQRWWLRYNRLVRQVTPASAKACIDERQNLVSRQVLDPRLAVYPPTADQLVLLSRMLTADSYHCDQRAYFASLELSSYRASMNASFAWVDPGIWGATMFSLRAPPSGHQTPGLFVPAQTPNIPESLNFTSFWRMNLPVYEGGMGCPAGWALSVADLLTMQSHYLFRAHFERVIVSVRSPRLQASVQQLRT
jgi:hypothetical protein